MKLRKATTDLEILNLLKSFENQNSVDTTTKSTSKNVQNQLTIMLLLVTTLFLLLLIPTYVRFLYFAFVNRDTPEKHATAVLFLHLSTRLYFTNSGINFFLYCISGKKFRQDLKELLSFTTSQRTAERNISTLTSHNDSFQTTDSQIL